MKKLFVAILVLSATIAEACPPPTGHFVANIGVSMDILDYDNISDKGIYRYFGSNITAGYETPCKWSTISLEADLLASEKYALGLEYKLNCIPFWQESPINFHIPVSLGYRFDKFGPYPSNIYFKTGLELNCGYIEQICNFFIKAEAGILAPMGDSMVQPLVNIQAGVHLWLGKH